jgi:chromosome segregation ATPase
MDAQKLNEMAKMILENGLASSTEEALAKAKETLEGATVTSVSDSSVDDERKERKLNRRLEAIEGNINMVISKMNELVDKINQLEKKHKEECAKQATQSSVQQTIQQPEQKKETAPAPRTGNFKPGDIDVMDFFNYGNK